MLWDLSAAFDTLDADILIKKLEILLTYLHTYLQSKKQPSPFMLLR